MKISSFAVSAALCAVVSASSLLTAEAKTASKTQNFSVNPSVSRVHWLGKKVTGQHDGSIQIKEGSVSVNSGLLTGGHVTIDMTSIKNDDLKDAEYNGKLVGHLKSEDFFSVDKHPTATFKVTQVQPLARAAAGAPTHRLTGDLTIKGITTPVSFDAVVKVTPARVEVTGSQVAIDRTLYGIRYGSGKFFQSLGDKAINDQFWVDFVLIAEK